MKVQILLATYNSQEFLKQLFDSLKAQTFQQWELLIKDDGSIDQTLEIIREYQFTDKRFKYLGSKSEANGAALNFMNLLNEAEADYFFFCDHDDVWLPDKIKKTLELLHSLSENNPDLPVIVHSDLIVVDKDFKIIDLSFWKYSGIKPTLLKGENISQVFNHVTGCTMAFNKNVKKIAFPYPKSIPMHDWWLVIQTLKYKGIIKELDEATILYRQHSSNEVGARNVNGNYFFRKIYGLKKTFSGHFIQMKFLKQIKGITPLQYYYYKIYYTLIRKF